MRIIREKAGPGENPDGKNPKRTSNGHDGGKTAVFCCEEARRDTPDSVYMAACRKGMEMLENQHKRIKKIAKKVEKTLAIRAK